MRNSTFKKCGNTTFFVYGVLDVVQRRTSSDKGCAKYTFKKSVIDYPIRVTFICPFVVKVPVDTIV